jgi:hypothetical protein
MTAAPRVCPGCAAWSTGTDAEPFPFAPACPVCVERMASVAHCRALVPSLADAPDAIVVAQVKRDADAGMAGLLAVLRRGDAKEAA